MGATVRVHSHRPSADPFRRVVVRLGKYASHLSTPSRTVCRSRFTRRDDLINLGVDVHRVLTVRPTVLVRWRTRLGRRGPHRSLFGSVVPLTLAASATTDCELHAGISCRTRTRQVTARMQMEEDAIRFDNVWNPVLGQSCHESLDAVDAFTSLNRATHP